MNAVTRLNFLGLALIVLYFTACTQVGFNSGSTNLSSLSISQPTLSSVTVNTKKNQSVSFAAGSINGQTIGSLSLSNSPGTTMLETGNGTIQITDPSTFAMTYTPNESFVGADNIKVYSTDIYGNSIPGIVTINVGNVLNSIQPALAVRGMSCITCHSGISSNIVTDYGAGSPWYFDTVTNDSYYADRLGAGNGLATLSLLNNSSIIVPQASVPAAIASQFNVTTLAQFVQARFAEGSPNLSTQVKEVSALKINIPTLSRIQQVFGNPSTNQVYIPDTQNSPALQGVTFDAANKVFLLKNVVCDGDLYLGAPVLFENAQVASIAGCRIYTTNSVFIDGNLQSIAYQGSTQYNTQILAAESIWVGAGHIYKNGAFCEKDQNGNATGWYAAMADTGVDCTQAANATSASCDTISTRNYNTLVRNTYTNAYPNAASLNTLMMSGGTIDQERAQVEASLGSPLYDISCGASGRAVSMNRLMLVAPYVNDRSTGDFSGSVIAEAALMSLGTFQFQFDPVFTSNSIFSLLNADELVSGSGI